MRKFISILSAAALVSSVVVVPISANAEGETVLWSDTFNAYTIPEETYGDWLSGVLVEGVSNQNGTDTRIPGITLQVGDRADGDDSTYWTLNAKADDETDKYLATATGRFATASRGAKLIFDETYTATSDKDIVLDFDVIGINCRDAAITYDRAFAIYGADGNTIIDLDTANVAGVAWEDRATIGTDSWSNIKVVVSTTGTTVYAGETEVASSTATSISGIDFNVYINGSAAASGTEYRIDGTGQGYPAYGLDNIVVYDTAAGTGYESEVPAPEDQEQATQAPTPTAPPPAAEITETTTIDFDTTDFAAAGVTVTNHKDYTTVSAVTDDTTSSTVLSVAQTSEKDTSYAYATFDLSALTAGKTHVIIDYDLKFIGDGRLKVILQDGAIEGGQATALSSGLISQGKTSSSSTPNIVVDEWVHTSVDVDFATGSGTYVVTKADTTVVGSGNITTDLTALTTMSLVSWSPNTSYIDNIVIQTGGEAAKATPEPASASEGSNQTLLPEGATQFDTFANIEGTSETVVNHSFAKPAVADGTASIYNADATIRGKSVYAAYDVLVNIGDSLSLQALGSDPSKIGTTFVLTGNQDGTASASALVDKGDTVNIAGNLLCGTWYRVLIEIPQNSVVAIGDDGSTSNITNTGNATYTIYRIDADDQSQVSEVAASGEGLTPRNLSDRAAASLKALVTGTPYIDNGVTFVAEQGLSLLGGIVEPPAPSESVATPEPEATVEGSGVNLVADGARETIATFASVEGTAEAVLNHSFAKPAAAGTVDAYSTVGSGNAVYAAYDVLVNAGDKLTVEADGNNKVGPAFIITGNEDGTATASYAVDKGEIAIDGNLVCGTWYRVVIEAPKTSSGIESSRYTIYRINGEDTTKTAGIAAQATGIGARNLEGSNLTVFTISVVGAPYIDNGVTYVKKSSANTWYRYFFTVGENGVKTVTSIESIDDPTSTSGKLGTEYYIWNALMQPYVPAADEATDETTDDTSSETPDTPAE